MKPYYKICAIDEISVILSNLCRRQDPCFLNTYCPLETENDCPFVTKEDWVKMFKTVEQENLLKE